jgi:hypothetical protein
VPEALLNGVDVGAAGEQPGGVGVAEVVGADVDAEPGGGEGRSPDVVAVPIAADVTVLGTRRRGGRGLSLPSARRWAR